MQVQDGEIIRVRTGPTTTVAAVIEALFMDPRAGPGVLFDGQDHLFIMSSRTVFSAKDGPFLFLRKFAGRFSFG